MGRTLPLLTALAVLAAGASGCAASQHKVGVSQSVPRCLASVPPLARQMSAGAMEAGSRSELAFVRRDASATIVAFCAQGSRMATPLVIAGAQRLHAVGGQILETRDQRLNIAIYAPTRSRRLSVRMKGERTARVTFSGSPRPSANCPTSSAASVRILACGAVLLGRWTTPITQINPAKVDFLDGMVVEQASGSPLGFYQEGLTTSRTGRLVIRFGFQRAVSARRLCLILRTVAMARHTTRDRVIPEHLKRCFSLQSA